jgi:hypothetical protein
LIHISVSPHRPTLLLPSIHPDTIQTAPTIPIAKGRKKWECSLPPKRHRPDLECLLSSGDYPDTQDLAKPEFSRVDRLTRACMKRLPKSKKQYPNTRHGMLRIRSIRCRENQIGCAPLPPNPGQACISSHNANSTTNSNNINIANVINSESNLDHERRHELTGDWSQKGI